MRDVLASVDLCVYIYTVELRYLTIVGVQRAGDREIVGLFLLKI